eukprot:PhM_4_TR10924/c0_g1_i2/m.92254
MSSVPSIPLPLASKQGADPVMLPAMSFGLAFGNWTEQEDFLGFRPEEANRALTQALGVGWRAIDGAHFYRTERICGSILASQFASGAIASRSEVFISTKLCAPLPPPVGSFNPYRAFDWNAEHTDEQVADIVKRQLWAALDDLGVGYVDMCLLHWPGSQSQSAPEQAARYRKYRAVAYMALMALHKVGVIRAVGVSNFSLAHLAGLKEDLPEGTPLPAVNQVEVNPYCFDRDFIKGWQAAGTVVQAYAPFASGAFGLLTDPVIQRVADAHSVTAGQVICRWLYQHGIASVPKSSSEARMKKNLDISFELTADEMGAIDSLSEGKEPKRTCGNPNSFSKSNIYASTQIFSTQHLTKTSFSFKNKRNFSRLHAVDFFVFIILLLLLYCAFHM